VDQTLFSAVKSGTGFRRSIHNSVSFSLGSDGHYGPRIKQLFNVEREYPKEGGPFDLNQTVHSLC
jgi:hypothetical protein